MSHHPPPRAPGAHRARQPATGDRGGEARPPRPWRAHPPGRQARGPPRLRGRPLTPPGGGAGRRETSGARAAAAPQQDGRHVPAAAAARSGLLAAARSSPRRPGGASAPPRADRCGRRLAPGGWRSTQGTGTGSGPVLPQASGGAGRGPGPLLPLGLAGAHCRPGEGRARAASDSGPGVPRGGLTLRPCTALNYRSRRASGGPPRRRAAFWLSAGGRCGACVLALRRRRRTGSWSAAVREPSTARGRRSGTWRWERRPRSR